MVAEAYRAGILVAQRALFALLAGGRPVLFDGKLVDRAVLVGAVDSEGDFFRFATDGGAVGFGHVFLLESLTAFGLELHPRVSIQKNWFDAMYLMSS